MASIVEPPWRPVSGPPSPKHVHCLSGGVENVDNKRQNIGKPLSPPRSSSPTGPPAPDVDSDSSEGSIPTTPPRPTSSSTTSSLGLNTTKSQVGTSGPRSNSLPTSRDPAGAEAHGKHHQGIGLDRNWSGPHDSPRGALSQPTSPQHAEKGKEHTIIDNGGTRIRLPSLIIPRHRADSDSQAMGHNAHHQELAWSLGPNSNNIPNGGRRTSSASERTSWSSSSPTSMPPPPLPSQSCAPQLESFPRVVNRAPGMPRTTALSVSDLIHREATGTETTTLPRPNAIAAAGDRIPSLASEFMDIVKLRERVSDANMPTFLNELNHQLSLTGLLAQAREHVCGALELTERQRDVFAQQTTSLLKVDGAARDMREVVARAVVGMGRRDLAGFECELARMLEGGLHKPMSPYREAICCAAYAARFPEDQQAELRRQLKGTPPAAFQQPSQAAAAKVGGGGGGAQPRTHNLPPLRECEKLGDLRRTGETRMKVRKDPVRPAGYSLREFPIFSSH